MTTAHKAARHWAPAAPSWARVSMLAMTLMFGWALLHPVQYRPQWWHGLIAAFVIAAFLGSWHGQHWSTSVRRWVPLAHRNRRIRSGHAKLPPTEPLPQDISRDDASAIDSMQATVTVHLRPQPHALNTPPHVDDQLPWDQIGRWFDRYGIRTESIVVTSVTRTPPRSALRQAFEHRLSGSTPQHRDTWVSFVVRAEANLEEIIARGVDVATLADSTARRLVAELREQGWLATVVADPANLPSFITRAAQVRKELWTSIQCSDGYRAVYAVAPEALKSVLTDVSTLSTGQTWVSVAMRPQGQQAVEMRALVATVTYNRPDRVPLPGLIGFHGMHRQRADQVAVTGSLPASAALLDLGVVASIPWQTAATGVPVGANREGAPVYVALASTESVRITIAGSPEFQVGMTSRLALSGLPVALYVADPTRFRTLADHGATQQVQTAPANPAPAGIVVGDGSQPPPAGHIMVTLSPRVAKLPAAAISIVQDAERPELFDISTPRGSQLLTHRMT